MNKQEILNEIEKTKQHLTNLEQMLEKCGGERWQPNSYETYYYVDAFGNVIPFRETPTVFKLVSKQEAEVEKILVRRQLEDIAKRLNKGQKIDWNNFDQNKYFISFNCATQSIERDFYNLKNKVQGVVYCLSDDFVSVAIQEIGEERLKNYLRGE